MVVYIEYAVLENFLLDALLLYLALKFARARVSPLRLLLASTVGTLQALLFPLVSLPAWCAFPLKLLGGALIALIASPRGTMKSYLLVITAFFVLTFLFGGALIAIYSAFKISYVAGKGFLLESAPVSFVLAGAGLFFLAAKYMIGALFRYKKLIQSVLPCELFAGGRSWKMKGFADTGNCLMFRGEPVCVVSAVGALALFRGSEPVGRMTVSTVNGKKDSPVFRCPKMTIKGKTWENVCFTAGEVGSKEYQIILHTAFSEGVDESTAVSKSIPQKVRGK